MKIYLIFLLFKCYLLKGTQGLFSDTQLFRSGRQRTTRMFPPVSKGLFLCLILEKGGIHVFEMKNKYRVTIFLSFSFNNLRERLRGAGFKDYGDKLVWEKGEDGSFEIAPFKKQSGSFGSYGYRILFDYDADTAVYLFESCLKPFKPKITNVEYQFWKEGVTFEEWRQYLKDHTKVKMIDAKGIFMTGSLSLYLLDDTCLIQYRISADKLLQAIRKVDSVKALVEPAVVDLFSFA